MVRYREKKYICGKYLEVNIYPMFEIVKGKRKKIKQTSEVQKALNNHNRKRKLTRLLNTNFTEEDLKVELTYADENLPENDEEVAKELRNFLRRLKRKRKSLGLPDLKYIVVTEKGKKTGRYHHHCVLSGGMLLKDIQDIWGKGFLRSTQLREGNRGFDALAEYMEKNLTHGDIEENEKAWHASRNLIQPKERTNDSRMTKRKARDLYEEPETRENFEKLYPGYDFVECQPFYNEVNGQFYLSVYLQEKEKPKIKRRKKKKCKERYAKTLTNPVMNA